MQHPALIFAGYSENMEEYLDTNIGLRRRIKLKFMYQDYSPVDFLRITLSKLLNAKFVFLLESRISWQNTLTAF